MTRLYSIAAAAAACGLALTSAQAQEKLKIGLTAGTPPADVIAAQGLMGNVRPYQLVVDTRFDSPGKLMIEDLAKGEIDVALLWGPIAGYYAKNYGDQLIVTPLVKEAKDARMDFYITIGVHGPEKLVIVFVDQVFVDQGFVDQGLVDHAAGVN